MSLKTKDILAEALRIYISILVAEEPNSPSGSHYVVPIDPVFLRECSSYDITKLLAEIHRIGLKECYFAQLSAEYGGGICAFSAKKPNPRPYYSGNTPCIRIHAVKDYWLILRKGTWNTEFVVIWCPVFDGRKLDWVHGTYFGELSSAITTYVDRIDLRHA